MRGDEAFRYHDRALAYLHGRRHPFHAASAKGAIAAGATDDTSIAIAIEGDDDERRIALRVRSADEATLAESRLQDFAGDRVTILSVKRR